MSRCDVWGLATCHAVIRPQHIAFPHHHPTPPCISHLPYSTYPSISCCHNFLITKSMCQTRASSNIINHSCVASVGHLHCNHKIFACYETAFNLVPLSRKRNMEQLYVAIVHLCEINTTILVLALLSSRVSRAAKKKRKGKKNTCYSNRKVR